MTETTHSSLTRYLDTLNDIDAASFIAGASRIAPRTIEVHIAWIRRGCPDDAPISLRRGNRLNIQRAVSHLNQVFADHEEACARRKEDERVAS